MREVWIVTAEYAMVEDKKGRAPADGEHFHVVDVYDDEAVARDEADAIRESGEYGSFEDNEWSDQGWWVSTVKKEIRSTGRKRNIAELRRRLI